MDFVLKSKVIDKSEQGDIFERKTFALGKYPSLLFTARFRTVVRSMWSIWGPFVAKQAPRVWGCSWHLASIQYPLDSGAAGCDPRRKTDGVWGLDAYCLQQSSTGTNKVAATAAWSKSDCSWTRGPKLSIKKANTKPHYFYSWKNILLPSLLFSHMESIFGILMFCCHVCLTFFFFFFDNAFLGSKPEVFLHVFQLGKTPSVPTRPLPK